MNYLITPIALIILPIILYVIQTGHESRKPSNLVIIVMCRLGIINLYMQISSDRQNEKTRSNIETIQKQLMAEQYKYSSGKLFSPPISKGSEQFRVIFGSNTFIGTPKLLVVDDIPLVTMAINNKNELIVNALIYNEKNKLIGLINNNQWAIEPMVGLRKESGINWLKVWDSTNQLILDIEIISDRLIKLNGVFRKSNAEIIATDEGMRINPHGSGIGLGGN